jgi:hypothetical protein
MLPCVIRYSIYDKNKFHYMNLELGIKTNEVASNIGNLV